MREAERIEFSFCCAHTSLKVELSLVSVSCQSLTRAVPSPSLHFIVLLRGSATARSSFVVMMICGLFGSGVNHILIYWRRVRSKVVPTSLWDLWAISAVTLLDDGPLRKGLPDDDKWRRWFWLWSNSRHHKIQFSLHRNEHIGFARTWTSVSYLTAESSRILYIKE